MRSAIASKSRSRRIGIHLEVSLHSRGYDSLSYCTNIPHFCSNQGMINSEGQYTNRSSSDAATELHDG